MVTQQDNYFERHKKKFPPKLVAIGSFIIMLLEIVVAKLLS